MVESETVPFLKEDYRVRWKFYLPPPSLFQYLCFRAKPQASQCALRKNVRL